MVARLVSEGMSVTWVKSIADVATLPRAWATKVGVPPSGDGSYTAQQELRPPNQCSYTYLSSLPGTHVATDALTETLPTRLAPGE